MLNDHHPRRHVLSFKYALQGLQYVAKTQRNFRVHLLATAVVVTCAYLLEFTRFEWMILTVAISFVLVLEMLNTIFEQLVDHLWQEEHPRAKIIKDVAAGAVLVGAIGAATVGAFLFLPYILY